MDWVIKADRKKPVRKTLNIPDFIEFTIKKVWERKVMNIASKILI